MVHSKEALDSAIEASTILFGKATSDALKKLDEQTFLAVFEGVPMFEVNRADIDAGVNIVDLLAEKTAIFPSKGELRRTVQGNGLSVNKEKYTNADGIINAEYLIQDKYILIQKGKKNYFIIIAK